MPDYDDIGQVVQISTNIDYSISDNKAYKQMMAPCGHTQLLSLESAKGIGLTSDFRHRRTYHDLRRISSLGALPH